MTVSEQQIVNYLENFKVSELKQLSKYFNVRVTRQGGGYSLNKKDLMHHGRPKTIPPRSLSFTDLSDESITQLADTFRKHIKWLREVDGLSPRQNLEIDKTFAVRVHEVLVKHVTSLEKRGTSVFFTAHRIRERIMDNKGGLASVIDEAARYSEFTALANYLIEESEKIISKIDGWEGIDIWTHAFINDHSLDADKLLVHPANEYGDILSYIDAYREDVTAVIKSISNMTIVTKARLSEEMSKDDQDLALLKKIYPVHTRQIRTNSRYRKLFNRKLSNRER